MLNESLLKDTLIGLVEMCRTQVMVTAALSGEVAALLESARQSDAHFEVLRIQKQAEALAHAEAHGKTLQGALDKFDETIQQLRDFLVQ